MAIISPRGAASAIILLTAISGPVLTAASWEAAAAEASDTLQDSSERIFQSLPQQAAGEGLPVDEEGWFWLRHEVELSPGAETLLLEPLPLGGVVWLNGREVLRAGSGPPRWGPPSPDYARINLLPDGSGTVVLLVKAYLRRGFSSLPGRPVVLEREGLRYDARAILNGAAFAVASLILGLILFIGAAISQISRGHFRDIPIMLFGLFTALSVLEPVLAMFPDVPALISWSVVAAVSRASLPFALLFWRHAVLQGPQGALAGWFPADTLIALVVSFWSLSFLIPADAVPVHIVFLERFDITSWYALAGGIETLLILVIRTFSKNRRGLGGSMILFLLPFIPVLWGLLNAPETDGILRMFEDSGTLFAGSGLAVGLLAALPLMAARRTAGANPMISDIMFEESDDAEELSPLDTGGPIVQSNPESADLLRRSLRATLYPESIAYDPHWDMAATRQGVTRPSTGFYDIYAGSKTGLKGFSFADTGADSLEATVFSHLVRSRMSLLFSEGKGLGSIARKVHRETAGAANAAGRTMQGVIGRMNGERVAFLPVGLPPLLLKRKSDGKVISLAPGGRSPNAPLGSRGFGADGLKALSIGLKSGDTLLAFAPGITTARSPIGKTWGNSGLAGAFASAGYGSAQEIVSSIVSDLKDFTGREETDVPVQMLVIRRR